MDELGKDCAKLVKIKAHNGAPSLFRITLVGSRGSGCTTLAKYLAERFNLVHGNARTLINVRNCIFSNASRSFQLITIT